MTPRPNTFGAVASSGEFESSPVTDLAAEPDSSSPESNRRRDVADSNVAPDSASAEAVTSDAASVEAVASESASPEAVAALLRERAERVRRRELDAAFDRLAARGDLSPEERRLVAQLSADFADALVERWTAGLRADGVDEECALELLSE